MLAGETVIICRGRHPQVELKTLPKPAKRDPLQTHPDLACHKINCDLTTPLSDEEWPEASIAAALRQRLAIVTADTTIASYSGVQVIW